MALLLRMGLSPCPDGTLTAGLRDRLPVRLLQVETDVSDMTSTNIVNRSQL